MAHELAHSFGLYHTFKNNAGDTDECDGACREIVASDDKGDYCADTNPMPKVHVKYNAATKTCYLPAIQDCIQTEWENAPVTNIMSYVCEKIILT